MHFHFKVGTITYDLTDYVDSIEWEIERTVASTQGGLYMGSIGLGSSIPSSHVLRTRGIISSVIDYNYIRWDLIPFLLDTPGKLSFMPGRSVIAVPESIQLSEWEAGIPLMRISTQWRTLGYAEDNSPRGGIPTGSGWIVNNDGDLPAYVYINFEFTTTQQNQQVTITGGGTPQGDTPLTMVWKGDVNEGDKLTIDSGVYKQEVTLKDPAGVRTDVTGNIIQGYPPFARVGTHEITLELSPPHATAVLSLSSRRRWRIM